MTELEPKTPLKKLSCCEFGHWIEWKLIATNKEQSSHFIYLSLASSVNMSDVNAGSPLFFFYSRKPRILSLLHCFPASSQTGTITTHTLGKCRPAFLCFRVPTTGWRSVSSFNCQLSATLKSYWWIWHADASQTQSWLKRGALKGWRKVDGHLLPLCLPLVSRRDY